MFDPRTFGESFHQFVQFEYELFGKASVFLHIASMLIVLMVFRYGNKYRKLFTVYFTANYAFLFCYWGIYGLAYWYNVGLVYLLVYFITPILLALILVNWIKEVRRQSIDLDFRRTEKHRFIVLVILVWGFWYPTYNYGQGFIFEFADILFSYYGLMPCPTTMVVLSLMTLNYPRGNRTLYNLLTAYALFIGTATVLSGWLPDVPFIVLGIYSMCLIIMNKRTRISNKFKSQS